MILRSRPTAFGLLFILRGSIITAIAPELLAIFAFVTVVAGLGHAASGWFARLTPPPFTLVGLALSTFLGFRDIRCFCTERRGCIAALEALDEAALPPPLLPRN